MNNDEPDLERLRTARAQMSSFPERGISEMTILTEQGSALAPLYLGWAYHVGDGVQKNVELAETFFNLSQYRGEASATYFLGNLYSELGDFQRANASYEQGAALGYDPSAYCAAMLILRGKYDQGNFDKAIDFLKLSAERGHLYSMRALAGLYVSGKCGIKKVPYGAYLFLKSLALAGIVAFHDDKDDRLRG